VSRSTRNPSRPRGFAWTASEKHSEFAEYFPRYGYVFKFISKYIHETKWLNIRFFKRKHQIKKQIFFNTYGKDESETAFFLVDIDIVSRWQLLTKRHYILDFCKTYAAIFTSVGTRLFSIQEERRRKKGHRCSASEPERWYISLVRGQSLVMSTVLACSVRTCTHCHQIEITRNYMCVTY